MQEIYKKVAEKWKIFYIDFAFKVWYTLVYFERRKHKSMRKIWKKTASFALILAIVGGIGAMIPSSRAEENQPIEADVIQNQEYRSQNDIEVSVYINGEKMQSRGKLIEDTTYMPLRSSVEEWESSDIHWHDGIASVKSDTVEISVQQGSQYITANGRILYNTKPIKNIDGRIYVPIRLLAKAYSLSVEWEGATRSVKLYGDPKGLKNADAFYNKDDLYWLSRIIQAESGGESLRGKIAVGNVVINRKNHKSYPNTIYGVIFDKKYGTQFTPVATGTIYKTPSSESVLAAKICLDGFSLNSEMIFFLNPKIATNFWITQSCTYVMTVGNHKFYK